MQIQWTCTIRALKPENKRCAWYLNFVSRLYEHYLKSNNTVNCCLKINYNNSYTTCSEYKMTVSQYALYMKFALWQHPCWFWVVVAVVDILMLYLISIIAWKSHLLCWHLLTMLLLFFGLTGCIYWCSACGSMTSIIIVDLLPSCINAAVVYLGNSYFLTGAEDAVETQKFRTVVTVPMSRQKSKRYI